MVKKIFMLMVLAMLGTGCAATQDDNTGLYRQNQELQSKLSQAEARLRTAPDPGALQSKDAELAARDARINELQTQLQSQARPAPAPAPANTPGIEGVETTFDKSAGTMTVDLPGDVLFDPGQDAIKESAKATLNKIASALKKDYAGKAIRVEGHTDADPILRSKERFADNLDLSLARAASVTRYLQTQGIQARSITTSGFGQTRPRGNDKARNRRVDIVVVVRP